MGLIAALGLTLAAGLLANLFLVRWLVELTERLLDNRTGSQAAAEIGLSSPPAIPVATVSP